MRFLKSILTTMLAVVLALPAVGDDSIPAKPAEDFVRTSVLVAGRGEKIYSALGHACIRMQCPDHALDYVFSYEGESVEHNVARFFAGDLKMALCAVPTDEYLDQYRQEGRRVTEYALTLPIAVKQRLWQNLDGHLSDPDLMYDYINRGCAVSTLRLLLESIDRDSLTMAPWGEKWERTRKDMGYDSIADPWHHFIMCTICDGEANATDLPYEERVMVPTELIEVLQGATAYGRPLMEGEGRVLLSEKHTPTYTALTPTVVATMMLLIALLGLVADRRGWNRWIGRGARTVVWAAVLPLGVLLCYLVFVSDLTSTQWNNLLLPFSPLPFLVWKWRARWWKWFAALVLVWCIGVMVSPHQLAEAAHIILAAALVVTLKKVTPSSLTATSPLRRRDTLGTLAS